MQQPHKGQTETTKIMFRVERDISNETHRCPKAIKANLM